MNKVVNLVLEELKNRYSPHTIILYGSYARNEESSASDVDIACFCDIENEIKDARLFEGVYLDAWIYPTASMNSISDSALRFADGILLHDEKGLGAKYLENVHKTLADGRNPMSDDDLIHLKEWIKKMLSRASSDDLDGNYRRTWLQFELLSVYFEVRGLWFLGHKKSFDYLKNHDREVYELFCNVYSNPMNIELLERLAKRVVCI